MYYNCYCSNMLMELLLVEIVNKILLQVDKLTLYQAVQVCKQWRHLAVQQIVMLMISRGTYYWNKALKNTCRMGQQALVHLLISKGAVD